MTYNKLVRDKIPELMSANGEKPIIRILEDAEYRDQLERKLDEEAAEFHQDQNIEELADLLEVVLALNESLGHSKEELLAAYRQKHEARGGFSKKVYLIGKE